VATPVVDQAPGALTDEQRRASLRRMKAVPLALLVFAALVYVVARIQEAQPDAWGGWSYLRAMAEAGVVGGLADWFAVTALFRHPLGLPIPHTALIARKKDQLGGSLSMFVRQNFLQAETVREKVASAQPSLLVGRALQDPANRARAVAEACTLADTALSQVKDGEVQLLVRNFLFRQATQTALAPPTGRLLAAVVEDRNHTRLVDLLFSSMEDWLRQNRATVVDTIASQGPVGQGGVIRWAHEQIAAQMYKSALNFVVEARTDPEHRTRQAIDDYLWQLAQSMQHDDRMIERVERWKLDMLEHEQTQAAVAQLWPTMRRLLHEALTDPASDLRARLDRTIEDFADRLVEDETFAADWDRRAQDAAVFLVDRYGDEAVSLISDTVARWDAQEAAEKIELTVGRDLQFIRINGTVVGALVGLTIHTLSGLLL
jgi:uncharacterized membrane-anchored protein YjiN (DUF445 family)